MVFWILLALVILIPTIAGIVWRDGAAFGGALIASVLGGLVVLAVIGIFGVQNEYKLEQQWDTPLAALSAETKVSGKFYLTGGYVNSQRTLNYVWKDNGSYALSYVPAHNARIVESDKETPHITSFVWVKKAEWLAPWDFGKDYTYSFTVPKGSVTQDFTINN